MGKYSCMIEVPAGAVFRIDAESEPEAYRKAKDRVFSNPEELKTRPYETRVLYCERVG